MRPNAFLALIPSASARLSTNCLGTLMLYLTCIIRAGVRLASKDHFAESREKPPSTAPSLPVLWRRVGFACSRSKKTQR